MEQRSDFAMMLMCSSTLLKLAVVKLQKHGARTNAELRYALLRRWVQRMLTLLSDAAEHSLTCSLSPRYDCSKGKFSRSFSQR